MRSSLLALGLYSMQAGGLLAANGCFRGGDGARPEEVRDEESDPGVTRLFLTAPERPTPDDLEEDTVRGQLRIEGEDGKRLLESGVEISLRGATARFFPQKSFALKLRNFLGMKRKASVLGMPAATEWGLVACWVDKTCVRNPMGYWVGKQMGRWSPRHRFVEVSFNARYDGLYLLVELPRVGSHRMNLEKPDRTPSVLEGTGDYVFKREGGGSGSPQDRAARTWLSPTHSPGRWPHRIAYDYFSPKPAKLTPAQKDYLRDHMARFEAMMKGQLWNDPASGYPAWVDVDSWVDAVIVSELSNNVDAYWRSMFLVKERDSPGRRGKISIFPFWDFNLAFGGADYRDGWRTVGWRYQYNLDLGECSYQVTMGPPACSPSCCKADCVAPDRCWNMPYLPFWVALLLDDPAFRGAVGARWRRLRAGPLAPGAWTAALRGWRTALAGGAVQRHLARWPMLHRKVWPSACQPAAGPPLDADPGDRLPLLPCDGPSDPSVLFDREMEWVTRWIERRAGWLDEQLTAPVSNRRQRQ